MTNSTFRVRLPPVAWVLHEEPSRRACVTASRTGYRGRVVSNHGAPHSPAVSDAGWPTEPVAAPVHAEPVVEADYERTARDERKARALAAVPKLEGLFSEVGDDVAAMAGDKFLLDLIDDLDPFHRFRRGLRVKVEFMPPSGVGQEVPGDWASTIPTQSRLAQMVGDGHAQPGRYRVLLRHARGGAMPYIEFAVAPPVGGVRSGDSPGLAEIIALVKSVQHGTPLAPEDAAGIAQELEGIAGDVAELRERVEKAEAQADDQEDRLAAVEATIEQVAASLMKAQGGDDGDGLVATLAKQFMEQFMSGGQVARDAEVAGVSS